MGFRNCKKTPNVFFEKYLRIIILNMGHTYFDCMLPVKQYNEQYDAKLLKFIREYNKHVLVKGAMALQL